MYDELDYLTPEILNYIENRVVDLYEHYSIILSETYVPKTWELNEYVFVDDVKHIEDGIDKIGENFGYPDGFIKSRIWNLTGENNISYRDLNRWLKNIEFLINSNFVPLMPSETLYPRDGYIYPSINEYPGYEKYNTPLLPSNNILNK